MSETKQPNWQLVGTVGDVNPLEYSGGFVYVDTTGVYAPELEWIESEDSELAEPVKWTVYRIMLETCKLTSFDDDSHLICGKYETNWQHPQESYVEWFDSHLESVASVNGANVADYKRMLTSDEPMTLASAYLDMAQTLGWENFDSYPLTFTSRADVEARYQTHKG